MHRSFPALVLSICLATGLLAAVPADGPGTGAPAGARGVLQGDLGPAPPGPPLAVAPEILGEHAGTLRLDADRFRFEDVRHSRLGTHVRGHEVRGGVPVMATSAAVHVVDGRVVKVEARPSSLPGTAAAAGIDARTATASALRHLGTDPDATLAPTVTQRRLVAREGRLVDVHRVHVVAPGVAAAVDVRTADGVVVGVEDVRRFDDATATVFDPNPVVTAQDPSLRQTGPDVFGIDTDLSTAAIDAELVVRDILEYDPVAAQAGRLVGPWADVRGPAPLGPAPFEFTKTDPRFETTMAYHHVDAIQRYFQSLGFENVNAEPQLTITYPVVGFDNSFYVVGYDLMLFGAGGVDDAEDAEVIVHEYGHAVHDDQVPGWGQTAEGGAMGEGWGDLLAAAYYARVSGGFQDACVADWDAVSYSSSDPPCLRRTDGTKTYPDDLENQVHADGELWSALLWRVRDRLVTAEEAAELDAGGIAELATDRLITLVLSSHELLSPTAEFVDGVDALIQAAELLDHPEWAEIVREEADATGMPHTA